MGGSADAQLSATRRAPAKRLVVILERAEVPTPSSEFVAGIREDRDVAGRDRVAGGGPGEAPRDGLWKRVIDAGIALIPDLPM